MEMTPKRQALIEAHVAETRRLMSDYAFELNDLVRFALSASRDRSRKVYYPMDPVTDGIRDWVALGKKVARLAQQIENTRQRLGAPPFDAEQPAADDPSA